MKYLIAVATVLSLSACGRDVALITSDPLPPTNGTNGSNGSSIGLLQITACSTQCPAGGDIYTFFRDVNGDNLFQSNDVILYTQTVCNGVSGQNGANGNNGTDGANGTNGVNGTNGLNGTNGSNGTNGTNGYSAAFSQASADRSVCPTGGTVINMGLDTNRNGSLETSEVTQVAVVCNGAQGPQGMQGASAPSFTAVTPITPCGSSSSSYKEVLMGMANGVILSEFSGSATNANLVRNTLLPDGSYYDTDDSQCNFSVSTATGNRTVQWNGTSGSGNTYHPGQAVYSASTQQWTVTY